MVEFGTPEVEKRRKPMKERKSGLLRALSRKKPVADKDSPTNVQEQGALQKGRSKSMSRAKSQLARTRTGCKTIEFKDQAILKYPFLAMQHFNGDPGRDVVVCGTNSIMAEICDMVTMTMIMEDSATCLTHSCVDRFFDWLPFFSVYIERYFFVEEDVLLSWVLAREGAFKGKMRASIRMCLRGKLQKMVSDMAELQDKFPHSLPAGERISLLVDAVNEFTTEAIGYFEALCHEIPPIINSHYKKADCEKLKSKWVKHVVEHVGTEDFLVLYTRWMPQKDLREWKTKILLPTDFKFMAYSTWEKDMDYAHFQIVSTFAEQLNEETRDDDEMKEAKREQFMRYKDASRKRQKQVNGEEIDDDDEYYDDEYEDGDGFVEYIAEGEEIQE